MTARRLTKKQQAAIDKALAEMERETGKALVRHATAAAIAGDASAQQAISGKISWDLVNTAALDRMQKYAAEIARGGSTCVVDGKPEFVPWLSDSMSETRGAIIQLVDEHIRSGGTLGRKEGSQGYQPGSLADKLSEYFDERKSHASTIARTEMSKIRNDAAFGRYMDAGVEKFEIVGGPEPCEECADLHGVVYTAEYLPYLPVHQNCTDGIVPVFEKGGFIA